MLKKMYQFVYRHIVGIVRTWMVLLIPCAISRHFAQWMLTANVSIWLLMICGQYLKWDKEV